MTHVHTNTCNKRIFDHLLIGLLNAEIESSMTYLMLTKGAIVYCNILTIASIINNCCDIYKWKSDGDMPVDTKKLILVKYMSLLGRIQSSVT